MGESAPQYPHGPAANRQPADSRLEGLTTMAGGMAHDFNNFLAAIVGNAAILDRGLPPGSPLKDHAQQVEQAAERALALVQQLLTFAGRAESTPREVDLSALVRDMENPLAASLPKGIAVTYRLADGLPPIHADPAQISRAALNLISNAAEAIVTRQGTVTVSTGCRGYDHRCLGSAAFAAGMNEGRHVFLDVEDTGCGMSPAVQARIFDPFFTTKLRATGMGLPVVLGIVRSHGGAVFVESRVNQGTRVSLLFPCARPAGGI